ncbi:hypothetical protein, partial [Methylobacterium sp. B4]|uniref:hypothetical protein n=1 Tax=Methylobacterium sp. B4 TaxID=1938755 RepID=UPI001AEC8E0D
IRLSSSEGRTLNHIPARTKTPDDSTRSDRALERFSTKWMPVRRRNARLEETVGDAPRDFQKINFRTGMKRRDNVASASRE